MKSIQIKNLSKSFTYHKKAEGLSGSLLGLFRREQLTKEAVKNISFDIQQGEFVGFIGANGAGKTTTLKMLSGILTPSAGRINVIGHNPTKREDAFKKKISIVMGQKSQLWMTLPPIETFSLIKEMYEIPEAIYRKRLKELSDMLDVSDLLNVQARKLSLGQRMKCELIASLLHDPKVLFLDEPTIGLDIISQNTIREFLAEYNCKKKTTIILTSHYMEDIRNLCKRIIIINKGEIILDDSLEHIMARYSVNKIIKVIFQEKVLRRDLAQLGNILELSSYEAEISVPSGQLSEAVSALMKNFSVKDLTIADVTLEEIIGDILKKA